MRPSFEFCDSVVGFLTDKEISEEDATKILSVLEERLQRHSQVSLYLEDEKNNGITFKAMLKCLSFGKAHAEGLKKVAVVTDSRTYQAKMRIKDFLIKSEVEVFDYEERIKAMNRVME